MVVPARKGSMLAGGLSVRGGSAIFGTMVRLIAHLLPVSALGSSPRHAYKLFLRRRDGAET